MSKANSAVKVLRTALKRVQDGWTKSSWHIYDRTTGKNYVCLEGAIYGYCDLSKHGATDAQKTAINVVKSILVERTGNRMIEIPDFNDAVDTTQDDVVEVIKLGIIRLETGWTGMDDDEFEDLLEHKDEMA